jgi:hypothetical protein
MRDEITKIFLTEISPYATEIKTVAVVGGSEKDPEAKILVEMGVDSIDYYGIDPGMTQLDLNFPYKPSKNYDLVICSQVLEHIFDVKQGLQTLANLTSIGGFLWIGCPASNRSHGSPHYFSAGYQPELIINLLKLSSVNSLSSGVLGSKRLYFMTHALRVWPSRRELKNPILSYDFNRRNEKIIMKFIRFFYDLPGRVYSTAISGQYLTTTEYATETYVFGQKM